MQTTTQPAAPASERPALAAFTLRCPLCGEAEAPIAVLLNQLDCQQFRCETCNSEFSIEDLEDTIAKWQKVVLWVRSVPQFPAAE